MSGTDRLIATRPGNWTMAEYAVFLQKLAHELEGSGAPSAPAGAQGGPAGSPPSVVRGAQERGGAATNQLELAYESVAECEIEGECLNWTLCLLDKQ